MGGKSSKPKPQPPVLSSQDSAILDLKRQRDRLSRYTVTLNTILQREKDAAKQLMKDGKTERAKLALRRKKYQEGQRDKVEKMIDNLDQMVNSIEYATIQAQVVQAIQNGNAQLTKLNAELNIEDVESLMDETAEAIEYQNKISEMLGTQLTGQDEEDVMNSLDEMQRELEGGGMGKEKERKDVDISEEVKGLPETANKNNNIAVKNNDDDEKKGVVTKKKKEVILGS